MMTFPILLLPAVFAMSLQAHDQGSKAYVAEIEGWRERHVASLKANDGWLSVAGLFWLKEGKNNVGAGPGSDILLPAGSAPARVGAFQFHDGATTFDAAPGVEVTVDGKPATHATMKPDTAGSPEMVCLGSLTMFVIKRGDRYGIRLRDKNAEGLRRFTGLRYFPIQEEYRLKAMWVPYDPPKMIAVPNILGQTEMSPCPGRAEFMLEGKKLSLEPVGEGDMLFFIFKDLTSGHETYPPGRFLYADLPQDGEVTLDFNKAVNPPCAFTPYATCPLPPPGNQLPIRIEAGELRYGH